MRQFSSEVWFTRTVARGIFFGSDLLQINTTFQNEDYATYEEEHVTQMTQRDEACHGLAWPGIAWHGLACHGMACQGKL